MNLSFKFRQAIFSLGSLFICALAAGCAAPAYTTDDGSPVDEKLLTNIRLYGKGEQILRPSIVKSAQLKDKDCDKQWELPFVVATSYKLPHMEKIAWVRGLQVDERLSVVAATDDSGLQAGDKIQAINGRDRDPDDMLSDLLDLRDWGREFEIALSTGRKVKVTPIEVCRGHVQITKPDKPDDQDYHWLQSTHPMSIFNQEITPDEAMWMVLWTQGLSEEAGLRMKTYHYGMKLLKTTITIASIASGVGAAASAAQAAAANVAATEAGKAAAQAAGKEVAKYAADQVADSIRQKMIEAAVKEIGKAAAQDIALSAVASAGIFKSNLTGVSWVAGTGFYMADKWALDRMEKLGADPLAAYTLHYKLASHAQADNAFVFDEERLENMKRYADAAGFGEGANLALTGSGATIAAGSESIPLLNTVEVKALDLAPAVPETAVTTNPVEESLSTPAVAMPGNASSLVQAVAPADPGGLVKVSIPEQSIP